MMSLALVVAAKGDSDAGRFFEALNAAPAALEIHVVRDDGGRLEGEIPADARLHAVPGEVSIFTLWASGIAATTADYVAILDMRCPPAPGWLAAIQAGLAAAPDALWGPVEPGYPYTDVRMTGYLAEYCQFHRPTAADMDEIPGLNLVLKRALAGAPADLAAHGFVKPRVAEAVAETAAYAPAAVVTHLKPFAGGAYRLRRYRHGRCYAAQRVRGPGAPPRLLAALFTPALPFLRVWRIHRHARRIEGCRRAFWRCLPGLAVAEAAWSWGEALGYVFGEGDCRKRLD